MQRAHRWESEPIKVEAPSKVEYSATSATVSYSTSSDNTTWSDWVEIESGAELQAQPGDMVKISVELDTSGTETPTMSTLALEETTAAPTEVTGLLQPNQTPHFALYICRPDGMNWEDMSSYLQSASIKSGDADGVIPTMQFSLFTDLIVGTDDPSSLSPADSTSWWNQWNNQYAPLLADCREVQLWVAFTAPGEQRPADGDARWQLVFHGVLGDDIETEGNPVTCTARGKERYLQDTVIEEEREYSTNSDMLAENVLQAVINDWYGSGAPDIMNNVYEWDSTSHQLVRCSTGFQMRPYKPEVGKSLWDICREVVDKFGWFVGYWLHGNESKLSIIKPPRNKTAVTADYHLDWRDDLYVSSLNLTAESIRNALYIEYTDVTTGERRQVYPHATADAICVKRPGGAIDTYYDSIYAPYLKSQTSIDSHRRRVAWISEAATSMIDTLQEAVDLGNVVISDLEEYVGTQTIEMPLCPEMLLFDGITVNDPAIGLTHQQFFGVVSYEHDIRIDGKEQQFRTRATALGKVVGGHARWLAMETRPGSRGAGIPGTRIVGPTPAAPTSLTVANSGVEAVGQDTQAFAVLTWQKPYGVSRETYVLEVKRSTDDWIIAEQISVNGTSHKIRLPGGLAYNARVSCVSKEAIQGDWSSIVTFTVPKDTTAPEIPTVTATGIIGGIAVDTSATAPPVDWAYDEVHMLEGTEWKFKVRGKQTRFEVTGLYPGQTYTVKVQRFDTSGNTNGFSSEVSDVALYVDGSAIAESGVATVHIADRAITQGEVYYIEDSTGFYTTSQLGADVPGYELTIDLAESSLALIIMSAFVIGTQYGSVGSNSACAELKMVINSQIIKSGSVRVEFPSSSVNNQVASELTITHIALLPVGQTRISGQLTPGFARAGLQAGIGNRSIHCLLLKR